MSNTETKPTVEEAFQTITKLYRMRDAAQKLYGEEYENKIREYKTYIQAYMKAEKIDNVIEAAIEMGHDLAANLEDSAIGIMNIFAAAVEITES
jgi:hypothetical protein